MRIKGRNGRVLDGYYATAVFITGLLMSVFQLYYLSIGVLDPWLFRGGHLAFALVLVFCITPATKKSARTRFTAVDALFAICSIAVFVYLFVNLDGLNMRAGVSPTKYDVIMAVITIFLVLEASRRYFGPVLPALALLFLLYAYFGRMIPGRFMVPSYSIKRIASYVFSTTGIYGTAISTSSTYVFLFVMFGAFLVATGVGDVFMDIAKALTGGVRGGPAKVSVISSALFGTVSGSASSNVVTTGAFTIPLMKKSGYRGEFAAAVETAASIGGLFMPPIMGAGGFLMADILQVPYWQVAKAAVVPAVLYYIVLFVLVDLETVRLNLKGLPRDQLPMIKVVLKKDGYLLIPVAVLLYVLIGIKASPVRAALWSIVSCIAVSWVRPETRMGIRKLAQVLSDGARQALNVSAATACAGIIIGIVQMTGVGLTFSSMLLHLGGTSIMLTLILSVVVAVILGMGLPITATYITVSAILAPSLVGLGIEPIAAHLFLYFYAAVSGMTPPVCVTAYAAAGVSGEDPIRVGFQSVRLGWAAYILPFMFVFGTPLLLIGTPTEVMVAVITALIGAVSIAAALHGYVTRRLIVIERLILVCSGLLLIEVGALTNYIGFGLLAAFAIFYYFKSQKMYQKTG